MGLTLQALLLLGITLTATLPATLLAFMQLSRPLLTSWFLKILHRCLGCLFLFDRIFFGVLKNSKNRIPEDFFFSLCFPEKFFTGTWFWRGSQEFLFFTAFTGIFYRNYCGTGIPAFTTDSSGFLWISLDFSGFLRIPPDSSGFLRISSDSSGFLRIPPDSSGFLRIPLDSSGFLRISVPAKRCLALASN